MKKAPKNRPSARKPPLRNNGLFLTSILENIPHMIFVKDARQLRFVRFNRAGEELLGIPSAEMIGKNDYNFFPKKEADHFTSKDRAVLDGGRLVDIFQEPIHTRKKGLRYLHTKKIPIYDKNGKAQYLLGISEDITERKAATEALRESYTELESRVAKRTAELLRANENLRNEINERSKAEALLREREERIRQFTAELEQKVQDRTIELTIANKELEAFSYSVSHDLRAPLRAIEGFAGILLEEYAGRLDAEGQRLFSLVRQNVKHMAQLIDDLLNFARIGRQSLTPQSVNIYALVKTLVDELSGSPETHKPDVVVRPLPAVSGDGVLLQQVFKNLLLNAYKFTRKVANPRIEVGCRQNHQGRIYYVRDNGVGFDMRYADKLFGVFQRLHTVKEFEGTGVGLAIVQRIVHRHGGRVWAEGKVGEGAGFYFTLASAAGVA